MRPLTRILATIDAILGLLPGWADPFEAFTFSPAGASVYQLGNFGTARRKLKTWELTPGDLAVGTSTE